MTADATLAIMPNWEIIMKLSETFDEAERKQMARDMFLVTQVKRITVKNEDGKNIKRAMTPYEALSFIIVCRSLGFEPMLDHIIMLEDKFYITLDWHRQNAYRNGMVGIKTELIEEKEIDYIAKVWENGKSKDVQKTGNRFKFKCTVTRKFPDGSIVEFDPVEWEADQSNVTGGDKATLLKVKQMAEARAQRRALSRTFPTGLGYIEDVQENEYFELPPSKDEKKELIKEKAEKDTGFKMESLLPKEPEAPAEQVILEATEEKTDAQLQAEYEATRNKSTTTNQSTTDGK